MLYVPSIELCVYWHSRTQPLPASSRHGAADGAAIADRSASAQFLPRWFFVECCLRQHYGIAAWFYQPAQTHKVTNQRDLSATVSNGASMTATRSTHNEVEPEDSLLELSRKHDSAEIEQDDAGQQEQLAALRAQLLALDGYHQGLRPRRRRSRSWT